MNESKSKTPHQRIADMMQQADDANVPSHHRPALVMSLLRTFAEELDDVTKRMQAVEASYQDATATYARLHETHLVELKFKDAERDALKAENARLSERVKRLEDVILWLDGRKDNFPLRPADKGIFWWRKEMMDRASIAAGKADQRAGGEVEK